MAFRVFAVGKRMPGWVEQGVADYQKRLPSHWRFELREFAQAKASNAEQGMQREADTLLDATPAQAHVVALDNLGDQWTTAKLSTQLENWQALGKPIVFYIGGPDGLHSRCRERSNQLWSLSALTYPHPLVRIVLLEQLYRAHSLLNNHPYHRA